MSDLRCHANNYVEAYKIIHMIDLTPVPD